MLSVCSATPSCCSHSRVPFYGGGRHLFPSQKVLAVRCMVGTFSLSHHAQVQGLSFRTQATRSLRFNFTGSTELPESIDFIDIPSGSRMLDDIKCGYPPSKMNQLGSIGRGELKLVDNSGVSAAGEELVDFTRPLTENASNLSAAADSDTILTINVVPENSASGSDSLDMDSDSLSKLKANVEDLFGGVNESIGVSVNSSVTSAFKSANEVVDSVVSKLFSYTDQARESSGKGLRSLSSYLNEAMGRAGIIAIDVLRHTIVTFENSLTNGVTFVVHSYGYAKELLPPEIQTSLNLSEEQSMKIFRPVGTALRQGLERGFGLDPADPIVSFFLLIGALASLWVYFWALKYGGYSGDLSPKSAFELLTGKDNVMLIDVRPEDLRERDGVPDLRRTARSRYANVALPQFNGSPRKLIKRGGDLDDALVAIVIQNLKSVQDRSKVIVMDADGTRAKGIARSLRKLGVKRPYLVHGGFQSWARQGLRVKELKPETTLTILNEEAEAILGDISLKPLEYLAYGLGCIVAVYALLEWEKALQFIGVIGLSQTIYRRAASYEDFEDFNGDIRLLLAPVRLGAQAVTWAVGRLDSNRNGLPTSPSSSDVQNRVLQAAAKHESQPYSDIEESRDPVAEAAPPSDENVDPLDA